MPPTSVMQSFLEFIKTLFVWWFIVQPWEQAIRVRFGRHVKQLTAGTYWKIPFFDIVYVQNTRRRACAIPIQTLTTRDNQPLTLHGSLGYSIRDVLILQQSLHDAMPTIYQQVQGIVSEYVATHVLSNCTPDEITRHVRATMDLEKYGLGDVDFFLTGYVARVRTYRLIQDSMQYGFSYGETLSTTQSLSRLNT